MKRIGIIGGGIGGLTTANFLSKLGHKVKLFEQAKCFIPTVGAGVSLSPNGQMVLNQLGYMDEFRPYLHSLTEMRTLNPSTGAIMGRADLSQIEPSTGYFLSGVKRAQLIRFLVDKLPADTVQYNMKFESLSRNNNTVSLKFADESTFEADLVIGADGIRSRVQNYVVDNVAAPHFTGYQAYYGTIHEEVLDKNPNVKTELIKLLETFPSHSVVALMKGGKYFITYQVGGANDKPIRVWAFLSNMPKEKEIDERWDISVENFKKQSILHTMASTFIPQVEQMIKLTPLEHILHFGLYDRPPLNKWHKDNVVLLGE
jgi:salicylate hydroxylase